jgi:N-acyl-D-aspartate/D-glutamate deacylase
MKAIMRSAMEHGALGVSFGMIYPPGCYAKTDELIEIAKIVGEYHGIAAIHLRSEAVGLVQAVQEFIIVVRESGVRGIISHHKAAGLTENWGKVHTTLRLIDQANTEGLELYADVYPYAASSTNFSSAFIPATDKTGGNEATLKRLEDPEMVAKWRALYYSKYTDTQWVMATCCPGATEYEGLRVPEIAQKMGVDEFTAAMELIRLTKNKAAAVFFSMCEEDVETVMAHPRVMICTDSGVTTAKTTMYHPRLRSSFPRTLGRYVRERGVVSLPEMIRKMTAMPCAVYGLKSKGLVWEGFDADLCIFDPETIIDRANYTNPHLHAEGLDYVIVGGKIAAENSIATGEKGGTMLYRDV